MPISANAVTLAQYALMSNDPLVQAVTFCLIENGNVMQDIPFLDKKTLIANGVRWEGDLPTVNWANLNEEGQNTSGAPAAFQEQAYIIRNQIDVDKYMVEDENQIVDPRAAQTAAYLKSVTYDFNAKFINNDHIVGERKSFIGLRHRIDNGARFGVRSENKISAGGVDLSFGVSGISVKAGNQFLELLDQMLWSVDSADGTNVVIYLNDVMFRRFQSVLRAMGAQGGLSTAKDQFDRTVTMYKNATLRDIGYKANQADRIIAATETADGATDTGGTHTSMYAVRYDTEHLFGWQFEAMKPRDLGLLENGVLYRTFFDWAGGLYTASNRSLARMHGIKLA